MRKARVADLDVVFAGGPDREGGGQGPMVVLLHGFGAPGDDLVPLGRQLAVPPEVRFVFPAAPLEAGPGLGRAWWHIDMLELQMALMRGDIEALTNRAPQGLDRARECVQALLDALERDYGMERRRLVLGGFSQGAMLSTDVTLHAREAPAALAILSGSLIAKSEWLPLMPQRRGLPVLQSHGRADPVLSFKVAEALRDHLEQAGLAVQFVPFQGGHGIPNSALDALATLITRVIG
jgi:phospholipase/carboxylesterase